MTWVDAADRDREASDEHWQDFVDRCPKCDICGKEIVDGSVNWLELPFWNHKRHSGEYLACDDCFWQVKNSVEENQPEAVEDFVERTTGFRL